MRRFQAVNDIPGLGEERLRKKNALDINKLDLQMRELLSSVSFAAKKDTKVSKDAKEVRSFLEDVLAQFLFTHSTLRILISQAYKKENYPIIADTGSLVREQLEKIYLLVSVFQNPGYWVKQYRRNAYQKDYERYLLMKDEYGKISRYDSYLKEFFPNFLNEQRCPPTFGIVRGEREVLVTQFAERCIRSNWYRPTEKKPKWFVKRVKSGSVQTYLMAYFNFPTPYQSMQSVKAEPRFYTFLDRWYREYKYFSSYSHVLMDKFIIGFYHRKKNAQAAEQEEIYAQRKAEEYILTSSTVGATLATLIALQVSNDFGTLQQTKNYWTTLCKFSLFAKGLWGMYPKDVL